MQNPTTQTGTSESLKLYIDNWCAWEPRAGRDALSTFCKDGQQGEVEVEKPALESVPAMQRRRLGPLARVVFHVLGQCADISKQEPVVFSSLMGEIQRTQSILSDIAAEKPVSPAAFSLSVHNAISGQWSLIHGIRAPMVALSPVQGSCVAALMEAAGMLQEKTYSAVNVVLYEEDFPSFYAPFLKGPHAPTALALRLISEDQAGPNTQQFSLGVAIQSEKHTERPGPLDLLPLLRKNIKYLDITESQSNWRLELSW
jgi:hypothetical protein